MRIKPEEIYAIAGLKVGDKIRITSSSSVYTILRDMLRGENGLAQSLDLLVRNDFEIIEDKIWNLDDININDKYWFVSSEGFIHFEKYSGYPHEDDIIKFIAFKEERYAKEYRDKLIQFANEYKKECE